MYPNLLGQKAFHKLSNQDKGAIIGVSRESYEQKIASGRFTASECAKYCAHFNKPFEYLFATDEELPKINRNAKEDPLRTVSCRMYFSETDPKYCTPDMLQTEKNDSYIVYMPDVVEDAVYGISEHYAELDLPESFFGGLLALNGYEGVLGA